MTDVTFTTTSTNEFGGAWDNTTFTVPTGEAGWYQINGGVTFNAVTGVTYNAIIYIKANGNVITQSRDVTSATNMLQSVSASAAHKLNEGDTVTIAAQQTSGSARTLSNARFSIVKLGGSGSGDSLWSDSGNGYIEYSVVDAGVKLANVTGMAQPQLGLASGMTWDSGTNTLAITGNITYTGTITDTSDRRLKTDIEDLVKYGSMLDKLKAIETYSFRMKDSPVAAKEFGVMAQELERIFPELVHTAQDEMNSKSVNYIGLIAPMIEATKELDRLQNDLRLENEILKAELALVRADQAQDKAELDSIKEQVALLNKLTADQAEKASSLHLWLALLGALSLSCVFGLVIVRRRRP